MRLEWCVLALFFSKASGFASHFSLQCFELKREVSVAKRPQKGSVCSGCFTSSGGGLALRARLLRGFFSGCARAEQLLLAWQRRETQSLGFEVEDTRTALRCVLWVLIETEAGAGGREGRTLLSMNLQRKQPGWAS